MDGFANVEVRQLNESVYGLLQHDHYTPKELARLVGIEEKLVCEAAFHGELRAQVLGHHVVSIRREVAITWLRRSG